jgi:Zn-dependent protease with chaperone function
VYQALELPINLYGSYLREHAYGLSNQTLSRWFVNYGKTTAVSIIGAIAFVWIFYLLLRKSPKRWWLYSSFVSMGALFVVMFIKPIWIDPLFNQFGPMKDHHLEKQVLALAERCGIENAAVFEVNKSLDTKAANAYVTGFGSTKRIVFYDTILYDFTPEQILFVTGHEIGHYVLHHLWWHFLYLSFLSFFIFYATYKSAHFLLGIYQRCFGFKELSQIASFPLFLFFFTLYLFLCSPFSNYISRLMEHEADRFGLELTYDNQAAAETFVKLGEGALINPRPGNIYKTWRSTHPPIAERVEFCNQYCPWQEKKPLTYESYFRN